MNDKKYRSSLCALLACVSVSTCAVASQVGRPAQVDVPPTVVKADAASPSANQPEADKHTKRILHAMREASTDGHPDLRGLFAGMRAYYSGDYKSAMDDFRHSARYAGKQSQLIIGLMYLHGRGVDKDAAAACAWLALAAERGYPRYEATRAQVCSALNREQHARALADLHELLPEYGDKVAVPRMNRSLRRAMETSVTGSLLGTDHGVTRVYPGGRIARCQGQRLQVGGMVIPKAGCGTYDPELWRPNKYYAARVPSLQGSVSVGDLHEVPAAEAQSGPPSDQAPARASSVSDKD